MKRYSITPLPISYITIRPTAYKPYGATAGVPILRDSDKVVTVGSELDWGGQPYEVHDPSLLPSLCFLLLDKQDTVAAWADGALHGLT